MENMTIIDTITEKKLDSWSDRNLNNFSAAQELTVTITLNEYRELVSKYATAKADIDKANEDRYVRESENRKLKEEISELKAKLYELTTPNIDGDRE